jgi:hypothetical protein
MSMERHAQIRRLFLAACELAENESGEFLDRSCAGDPNLREELESLLKQPRLTTIIGTSSEDAASGGVRIRGAFRRAKSLPPDGTRF